jgi:23S rRNA (pseudouridine1915-N3)-methyltransferase
MRIKLLTVGMNRSSFLTQGESDYLKRIKHYSKIDIEQIRGEKIMRNRSEIEILKVEGEKLLEKTTRGMVVVALDRNGMVLNSEAFAQMILNWQNRSIQEVVFVIGGPLGLSEEFIKRADLVLSLSPMTFPHEMVRLLLLEQLYRAFTILNGEKYHK